MFEKKLGEIRPNQLITTYGPGSIMDAVHDSLTVLDIEYWNANNIGLEIRDSRLASFMNVRHFYMPSTKGKENIPVASFPYTHVCTNDRCKRLFDIREELKNPNYLDNYKQHHARIVIILLIQQDLFLFARMVIWTIFLGDGGAITERPIAKRN